MIFRSVGAQKSNPIFSSPVDFVEVSDCGQHGNLRVRAGEIVISDSHTTYKPHKIIIVKQQKLMGARNQSKYVEHHDFQDAAPPSTQRPM